MWLLDGNIADLGLPKQIGVPADYILIPKEYDPALLGDLPAPRPQPRAGEDQTQFPSDAFTFNDAFEDLMHAHFNGEVMHVSKLTKLRTRVRDLCPNGETALCQAYRMWKGNHNFRIWRYNSILRDRLLAHPMPNRGDFRCRKRHPIFSYGWSITPFGEVVLPSPDGTPGWPMPAHETELAEAIAEKSSHSDWPSPFDTLRSLVGGGSQGQKPAITMSYSQSAQVTIDEHGWTKEQTTEITDDVGRHFREVLVRKSDAKGNVISETKRQFEDGEEIDGGEKDLMVVH